MSTTRIHIGYDNTLTGQNKVYVESTYGQVNIVGEFADWMGYKTLREYDDVFIAEQVAWSIARNPIQELSGFGYEFADWFTPVN
jgi:hypothetical protein